LTRSNYGDVDNLDDLYNLTRPNLVDLTVEDELSSKLVV
jgi:hypothetical protein